MTENELAHLIHSISYKDGYFIHRSESTVKVGFARTDVFTGQQSIGYGGTATIGEDATPGDVVRTVFGLFKALEEHECREWFKVDGVQVFSPHITFDALLEAGRHIQGQPQPMELRQHRTTPCPTCSDPIRETVGMVCQTCGTDYSQPLPRLDPDCRAGKHTACLGQAWDEAADRLVACGCSCHQSSKES